MYGAHFEYVLRLADNALILGQRLSEWCGHAPVLEEELALANVALDLIGQSRLLLSHAGRLETLGRDEDQLAFLRAELQYRNLTLVELPNADFARTVTRNFLFSAFQRELWQALTGSRDGELAAIAEKSLKETRYHLRHSADWVVRLGDGTGESHARMQSALDYLWPYTAELFSQDAVDDEVSAAGLGPAWSTLEQPWEAAVRPVLAEATLTVPARAGFRSRGKLGVHSEYLGHLLAEMQQLQRAYPGARW
ncbi:MAG TPA: 1,2-phenylacetyl-CoA epoxidase subunit PaaC [Burkholderiales bacterium]|nr:1,2-phenylacetyl-CoA epoxidase subunit PaaC [Burkholderiales bacterium]